jgi:hypothetical protein
MGTRKPPPAAAAVWDASISGEQFFFRQARSCVRGGGESMGVDPFRRENGCIAKPPLQQASDMGPGFSRPPKKQQPAPRGLRNRAAATRRPLALCRRQHSDAALFLFRACPDFFRTREEIFELLLLELHAGPEAPCSSEAASRSSSATGAASIGRSRRCRPGRRRKSAASSA